MDEAKVARDVDAYIDTGIADLKEIIAELESLPERAMWVNDSTGSCPHARLQMAKHRLATLEASKEKRARS